MSIETDFHEPVSSIRLDGMVLISEGKFKMGAVDGGDSEKPVHEVNLSPYYLDHTPVTNRQFKTFVESAGYLTTAEKRDGRISWLTYATLDRLDHPVVCVSWFDAKTYADWAGKRLPTEAEWEKAARGGLDLKRYPWGEEQPSDKNVNWNRIQMNSVAPPPTTVVAQFSANGYGLFDMAGNVWHWCNDWFAVDYYAISPNINPSGPANGQYRVRRGASWNVRESFRLRCANRGAMMPDNYWPNLGFRCAFS